ncbi:DUF2272 domain-containing protein [Candidatus Micrarchaeota archaeon]|nr:DUF2272 domain-containing protein [Candidatus Micrarchaeota archaeon]
MKTVNSDDGAARDVYNTCLDRPSSNSNPNCLNQCQSEVNANQTQYEQCLAQNASQNNSIDRPVNSSVSQNVIYEYSSVWKNGTKNETDPELFSVIKTYYTAAGCPQASPTDDAWSAAFVSYVMKQSGVNFPASCSHTTYFKQLQDNPTECKTYPMSEKSAIAPGDVICRCTGSNCNINYSNVVPGQSAHCDIVTDRSGDSISYIGGNRWSKQLCGDDQSVGCTVVKTTDKPIDSLGPTYFGFISCSGKNPNNNNSNDGNPKPPKPKPNIPFCPISVILVFLPIVHLVLRR